MTHFDSEVTRSLVANWGPPRMADNFDQIQRRLQRRHRTKQLTVALAALMTVVSVFWGGLGLWRAQTAQPTVTTRTEASTETRFRDGSTATALTPGAVLEVQKTSDSEIDVAAKVGSYRFNVMPNPARHFVVHIADVTVRVLGTEFLVAQTEGRVEVRVERGRVEVTWPSGRTELGADESGWFPPMPQTAVPATNPSATELVETAKSLPKALPSVNDRAKFIELSRQGDYQAAFSIIDRAPNLFESSAEDLMMAADAARLSNHPSQAVGYLQRITKEHARDSRAPLAAFTLGRIYMNQLGQSASAARAFALVRQLAPAGALVQDALAREAEALEQAGQHAAAKQVAEEYLRQYPSGRRSAKLRQLGKAPKSE